MIINRLTGEEGKESLPRVRHPLDRSVRVTVDIVGESRTHQSFREETDINVICDRFMRTGQLPPAKKQGFFGDVSNLNAPLQDVITQTTDVLDKTKEFFDGKEKAAKAAKADAAKATRKLSDEGGAAAQGGSAKAGAPKAEGGSGGAAS